MENPRLIAQLVGLERRSGRNGKDYIDHGPVGHDDLANSCAGALVLASAVRGDGKEKRERIPLPVFDYGSSGGFEPGTRWMLGPRRWN